MDSTENFSTVREEIQRSIAALKKADELLADKLEPLMTVEEVAAYFNCTTQTVYNMAANGTLNTIKVNGMLRFKRAEILSFGVDITA